MLRFVNRAMILMTVFAVACVEDRGDPCAMFGLVVDPVLDACVCPPGTTTLEDRCELPDGGSIPLPDAAEPLPDGGPDALVGSCDEGEIRACEGDSEGACDPGRRTCRAGVWSDCEDAIGPTPETCNGEDDDCDGARDGAAASAECARAARVDEAVCSAGACIVTSCDVGYDDCDSDASTGCEAELASDDANCGDCGVVCGLGEGCFEGECESRSVVEWAVEVTADQITAWDVVGVPGGVGFVGTVGGAAIRVNGTTVPNGRLGASSGTDSLIGVMNDDGTLRWAKRVGSTAADGFSAVTASEGQLIAGGFLDGTGDYLDGGFGCSADCDYLYGPATVVVTYDLESGGLLGAARRSSSGFPSAIAFDADSRTLCLGVRNALEMIDEAALAGRVENDGRVGRAWTRTFSNANVTSAVADTNACAFSVNFEAATDFGAGVITPTGVDGVIATYDRTGALISAELFGGAESQFFHGVAPRVASTDTDATLGGTAVSRDSLVVGTEAGLAVVRFGSRLVTVSQAEAFGHLAVALTPSGDVVRDDATIDVTPGDAILLWLRGDSGATSSFDAWRSASTGSAVSAKVGGRADALFSFSYVSGSASLGGARFGGAGRRSLVLARHSLRR